MTWFDAYDRSLAPLLAARQALALLSVCERTGLLAAVRETATPGQVAADLDLPAEVVVAACRALAACEVVEERPGPGGTTYRLTDDWHTLTGRTAFSPLDVQLGAAEALARATTAAFEPEDYWTMPDADRHLLARSVSPDPFSPGLVEAFRAMTAADPDHAVLADGGSALELGCGLAGRILTTLQALPAMRAVGVELSPDLAAEARERARRLGVADRFEVVEGDAADLNRPAAFDTAFWSQFFFAGPSRAAALATLMRCLRPGGVLIATLDGDHDAEANDPTSGRSRATALQRVVLASWGVALRSPAELVAELTEAGFVDVQLVRRQGLARVRAVRP